MVYKLKDLPFNDINLETREVFKAVSRANNSLGVLNGLIRSNIIPNHAILINTLSLQEAQSSNEIENIVTTQDELFKINNFEEKFLSPAMKEVKNYAGALKVGFEEIINKKVFGNNTIIKLNNIIKGNTSGFRKQSGTQLRNNQGQIIYEPPQTEQDIIYLMNNLEKYINDDSICDLDVLIKLAIIHHRFESIHPFYDGNGRVGRMINILYLVLKGLLNLPILYLSRYILNNKDQYYKLIKNIQDTNDSEDAWINWILYIVNGIDKTSKDTIDLILKIKRLMEYYKQIIKSNTNIYSHELLNCLFKHPHTTIEFLQKNLNITRQTASKYLNELLSLKTPKGNPILGKHRIGTQNYYLNIFLIRLLKKCFK